MPHNPLSTRAAGDGDARETAVRRTIAVGTLGTAAGVVTSTVGLDRAGAALTIGALAMLLWGLHRFGRLGPDRGPSLPR
jgi:hypothetical protein